MSKCGKGCMPECEYFTTGGCISPFNCMYKEESKYINSATSGTVIYAGGMNMTNEEMIENLRCVIEDISAQRERLKAENAELKSSLTHANEECLKWHERAQNLLKDSGGSISGYEKKISDLQSENAELRERLEKAVELPFEVGSTVYIVHETDEEDKINQWIDAGRVVSFSIDVNLWIYVRYNSGLTMWYTKDSFDKEVCITFEAAEARLAEIKEKKGETL